MIQHHKAFLFFLGSALLPVLHACTVKEPLRPEPYESGVIVLEAGRSGKGNASVSFINPEGRSTSELFTLTNRRTLGDMLRAYTEIDGKGYLVVSNSDKVEVVESSTFRSIATIIKDIEYCRYMVAAPPQSGAYLKGYISYWGGRTRSPGVAIANLVDRKVIGYISVGAGPEQMVLVGDELFVANSGGTGFDKTVSVINTTTDQVVATIPVGDVPTSILYESTGGLLHILCSGKPTSTNPGGTTTAELVRINPLTRQVVSRVSIGGRPIAGNPSNLVLHTASKTLYFLMKGAVYASPVTATSISVDRPLLNQSFTGLGVDPNTGIIYGGYSRDSTSKGVVRRFQPNGARIDSVSVGFVPNGFYFK